MSSEREFAMQVISVAHLYGWLVGCHDKSARQVQGRWISNILGDRGEPDLRLLRPPRFLVVELKLGKRDRTGGVGGGTYGLTPEQQQWKSALEACPGVEWYLWRPADLDHLAEVLR